MVTGTQCPRCGHPIPVGSSFCPGCGVRTPTGAYRLTDEGDDFIRESLDQLKAGLAQRYLIERELGRGGMAIVYLARDLRHNRPVAVKVLLPEIAILLGPDRFLREIEITARLQHPNIVPVHDSGNANGTLYYVMPFIEGESLGDRLKREGQLPLDDVLRIMREAADALQYAHDQGIIHRDIKPANILLSAGHAQVADFGIARAVSAAGLETLTQSGAIVGTPAYMAPEQAAGLPDIDSRVDLYALAAVAHEALVGTRRDAMAAVRTSENLLTRNRRDVSAQLARAISAPLALERDLRPRSASAWMAMIDEATRGRWRLKRVAVAAAAIAVLAVPVGRWLWDILHRDGEPDVRRVAILPPDAVGTTGDAVLDQAIFSAIGQQLQMVPGFELVSDTTQAKELLRFQSLLTPDSTLQITIRVIGMPDRRTIEQASQSASIAQLSTLVRDLLHGVYAAQIAEEMVGWNQALPEQTETWLYYQEGERRFRSGDYAEAIRQFDRVIEREPTYAPAHFRRLLTEVLRERPTRVSEAVEQALTSTTEYREALDEATRDMLDSYTLLLRDGDLHGALEQFGRVTERNGENLDAWFVRGYLKVNFAGLLGQSPTTARQELERAYGLDPHFAAVLAQLARIAWLQDNAGLAHTYVAKYLDLDSLSATAEVLRLADSAAQASTSARTDLLLGLANRPTAVLELVALVAGAVDQSYQDRQGSGIAIDELWERAATPTDLAAAFRMHMASHLGAAQPDSADLLLREGRRRGVPAEEIDSWLVLPAVTVGVALGSEQERADAAQRLAARTDDPTALWLAARWHLRRDPAMSQRLTRRLAALVQTAAGPSPLARALHLDLQAHDAVARGAADSASTLWEDAKTRYRVTQVPFGLVASLWPIELAQAQAALAAGDYQAVIHSASHFRYMAGFVDQVAWPAIWPLAAAAHRAAGDQLKAREVAELLEPVFRDATGAGIALRDSLLALGGVTR